MPWACSLAGHNLAVESQRDRGTTSPELVEGATIPGRQGWPKPPSIGAISSPAERRKVFCGQHKRCGSGTAAGCSGGWEIPRRRNDRFWRDRPSIRDRKERWTWVACRVTLRLRSTTRLDRLFEEVSFQKETALRLVSDNPRLRRLELKVKHNKDL
jgi:hypothetical protein